MRRPRNVNGDKNESKRRHENAHEDRPAGKGKVGNARPRNCASARSIPTCRCGRGPAILLRRLHQIHYALFFEECAGFDITPVQYGLLTTLSLNPDLDQNSLARELGIDRTNVADVLNRLARRGLVERRRSLDDRRMVLARLTRAGERLTKKMYRPMRRAQKRLLKPLLSQERNALS